MSKECKTFDLEEKLIEFAVRIIPEAVKQGSSFKP